MVLLTVVEGRGDVLEDRFHVCLRDLRRGCRHHRTQLGSLLGGFHSCLVVFIDSYLPCFNHVFDSPLLAVLTQGRCLLGYHIRLQVILLQLIIEIEEIPIYVIDFDHRLACVRETRIVAVLTPVCILEPQT